MKTLIEKYEQKLYYAKEEQINIEKNSCMDILLDDKIRLLEEIIDDLYNAVFEYGVTVKK